MKKSFALLLVAAILLNGCASVYTGNGPDLTKRGAEAAKEVEKFTLHHNFWLNENAVIGMGPEKRLYQTPTLAPMMNSVSTESIETFERARSWQYAGLAFLGVSLAVIFTAERGTTDWQVPFWAAWGAGVGCGLVSEAIGSAAIDQFNRDLKRKFAPQISYRLTY